MPEIFIKEFSEITIIETIKKAKVLAKQKNRTDYTPEKDFYKILREHIQTMHKKNLPVNYLENAIHSTTHSVRKTHYTTMVSQYKKWLKKKKISYFPPPRNKFHISATDIVVNPELGLNINGVPHNIKLFFNKEKLLKVRANYITVIMDSLWPNVNNAVLDVRNAKLFTFDGNKKHYLNAIKAEVALIEVMWSDL